MDETLKAHKELAEYGPAQLEAAAAAEQVRLFSVWLWSLSVCLCIGRFAVTFVRCDFPALGG